MKKENPLVNRKYLLQKFPGKGGWTYAEIPEIVQNKKSPFGWVTVKGSIDNYELKSYKLMPMGNGKLFLPVKAAIRKIINKQQGDYIHVILYADNNPMEIPEELSACLLDSPKAHQKFISYSDAERKKFIDWIYSARTDKTKVDRIAQTVIMLELEKKFDERNN